MNSLFEALEKSVGAAQVEAVPAADAVSVNIWDSAVMLNLTLKCFGTSRKLASDQYSVNADKSKTRASKRICQCKELDEIHDLVNGVRKWIKARTVPTKIKGGLLIIRLTLVPSMYEFIEAAQAKLERLVSQFSMVYEDVKWKDSLPADQGGLGDVFNASDYPPISEVVKLFEITCVPFEMGAPGSLKAIDKIAYEKAAVACKADLDNAVLAAQDLLTKQFVDLVDHIYSCLVPGADGKAKTFKNSSINNAIEYLQNYDFRNFGNPQELTDLVNQMKAAMEGVSPEDLRKKEVIRARVADKTSAIKAALDELVINKPSRKINLADSEDWGAL